MTLADVQVLSIVHQLDAGSGVFADVPRERGDELEEWVPPHGASPARPLEDYGAALVLGGSMHVDQEAEHPWLRAEKKLLGRLLELRVPLLGVCLGAQLLAEVAGGTARRAGIPEIGWTNVELAPGAAADPLLGPLPQRFKSFQWHSYNFAAPPGATALARNGACLQAFRLAGRTWGIQFHAEVTIESVRSWLAEHEGDSDPERPQVDALRIAAETELRIDAWNELGRGICRRFLNEAEQLGRD